MILSRKIEKLNCLTSIYNYPHLPVIRSFARLFKCLAHGFVSKTHIPSLINL